MGDVKPNRRGREIEDMDPPSMRRTEDEQKSKTVYDFFWVAFTGPQIWTIRRDKKNLSAGHCIVQMQAGALPTYLRSLQDSNAGEDEMMQHGELDNVN